MLRLAGCTLVLTLFTLGCPSDGGNGSPAAFSINGAAGAATITNGTPSASITLSWTNPSQAGLSVTLSGNPTGSTIDPAIDSTSSAANNITVSGLALETEYTLTVSATNSAGTADADSATVTTRKMPVVLWALGRREGNFGFALCQSRLTARSGIEGGLYTAGYRTATFLGSTPGYNWAAIDTDPDALGDVADRNIISTTDGTNFTSTFTASNSAFTMSQIAVEWSSGSNQDVAIVLGEATTFDAIWFFSDADGNYDSGASCVGASSTTGNGNAATIQGNANPSIVGVRYRCDDRTSVTVLCIAK